MLKWLTDRRLITPLKYDQGNQTMKIILQVLSRKVSSYLSNNINNKHTYIKKAQLKHEVQDIHF